MLQPAVQLRTWPALDRAAVGAHRVDAAVAALEAEDLGVRVDLGAARVGAAGEAPDDRVVADDAAGRVVERAQDRIRRVRVATSIAGRQALDLVGVDQARVDPVQAVDLGAVGHDEHRAVGVRERQVAALREQQVEVELLREALVELHARVVEARALGRLVVRAQDRRVAPGRARADVALLEHRDIGDPVLSQVVRGGQAVRAAADDDDVVGVLQLRALAPHPALAEDVTHGRPRRSQRVDAHRRAAQCLAGVGHHRPHVLAQRPAEQQQEALVALAQDEARRAGDRSRAGSRRPASTAAAGRGRRSGRRPRAPAARRWPGPRARW